MQQWGAELQLWPPSVGAQCRARFALPIAHPLLLSLLSLLLSSFKAHLQALSLLGALQRHQQTVPVLSGVQRQQAGR